MIVNTPLGKVEGIEANDVCSFLGLRYAKPPVGARRFRAPEPVGAWDGVFDATAFGPAAVQPQPVGEFWGLPRRGIDTSEDCLFLNVHTPAADDARRPVMVWIHGGSYTTGSGSMYDGGVLSRRGDVVAVTINYRLGLLGFAAVDHLDAAYAGSGNNGIRDQIAALEWVRDNIEAFGGDPGNVTVFGESAGGGSVAALLAAPAADGLYHRAIIQSGGVGIPPGDGKRAVADAAVAHLGGTPDRDGLQVLLDASPDELLAAQTGQGMATLSADVLIFTTGSLARTIAPAVDGIVITRTAQEAVRERGTAGVPVIIGTNRHEGTLFGAMMAARDVSDDDMRAEFARHGIDANAALRAYRDFRPGGTLNEMVLDASTDGLMRSESLRLAEAVVAAGMHAWVYLFTWETDAFGGALGATHALELPFLWDWHESGGFETFLGSQPWPTSLSGIMQNAWTTFARFGDPNHDGLPSWPVYDDSRRPTLILDAEVRIEEDPDAATRRVWA